MVVELVGRADLLDPALVDHHDPVGHLQGLLLVVSDEDRGDVYLVVQPSQPGPQLLADLGVKAPNGSSSSSTVGSIASARARRHPLPLAAGQLGRQPVGELGQVHQLEQLRSLGRRSPGAAACGS